MAAIAAAEVFTRVWAVWSYGWASWKKVPVLSDEFPIGHRKLDESNPKLPKWAREKTMTATMDRQKYYEGETKLTAITMSNDRPSEIDEDEDDLTKTDHVNLAMVHEKMTPLGQTNTQEKENGAEMNRQVDEDDDATVPIQHNQPKERLESDFDPDDFRIRGNIETNVTKVEMTRSAGFKTEQFFVGYGEEDPKNHLKDSADHVGLGRNNQKEPSYQSEIYDEEKENETHEFMTSPYNEAGLDDVDEAGEATVTNIEVSKVTSGFTKRTHKRFSRRMPIEIECDGQIFSTYSVDVSVGGVLLEDPLPRWVSGYSKVRLRNEKSRQVVELTCYIVENQRPKQRHRVALLPLKNRKDEEHLEEWIKAA